MRPFQLLSLWLSCHACCFFMSGEALITEEDSCSRKCESPEHQKEGTSTGTDVLIPYPCSCTSSCSNYGDCCKDSPFRYQSKKPPRMMCLSVSGRGGFRAISKCPKEWSETSHFCTESIGYLPPVTSQTSGNTYANVYCAVCHGDMENLKTWSVDLRCCSDTEESYEISERRYVYRKGHLWSRDSQRRKCLCRYHAQNNDTSFLDNLELRTCDKQFEVSKCSSSWEIPVHQDLCKSFLDPVYVADVVYRNLYCAECNFKRIDEAECQPAVVEDKLSEGLSTDQIMEFCVESRKSACVHYLMMTAGRGKLRRFANLFDISEKRCVPPKDKRCCVGERYDFRTKRCRKLNKG